MKSIFSFLILCFMSSLLTGQCYSDRHNTSSTSAWVSCSETPNPNSIRGNSHWVKYDFNYTYELSQMVIWNYNETDHTDAGIQDIVIDYSLDGTEWIEWGTFTLEQATGSSIYEGDLGPDFNGLFAKHILITAISNYGDDCYGLSEMKIGVESFISNIDEPLVGVELTLSPVPADQFFTLDVKTEKLIGNLTYSIIDMQGKLVQRKALKANDTSVKEIVSTSDLPNGQYIVALQSDLFTTSRKIVILHP